MMTPLPPPILLDLPDQLRTQRLLLRPPGAGDGARVCAAVRESLPALREFPASLPWALAEPSDEGSEVFCRQGQAGFLARQDFPFLVFDAGTDELVASVGIHRINWSTPKAEIGYWCRSSMTGRGLVREAAAALADFAFRQLGMVRLEILCDAANLPSRRVAMACGFELEGVMHQERRAPDGSLRDTCLYARWTGARTPPGGTAI